MQVDEQVKNCIVRGFHFHEERIGWQKSDLHHPGLKAVKVVQVPTNGFVDDGCLGQGEIAAFHSVKRTLAALGDGSSVGCAITFVIWGDVGGQPAEQ